MNFLISSVDFDEQVNEVVDDFGTITYVVSYKEKKKIEVVQENQQILNKKQICLDMMKQVLTSGNKLVRIEMINLWMKDERLKFQKSTGSTYFYSCMDELKKLKLV
jgi:hypothetical protein